MAVVTKSMIAIIKSFEIMALLTRHASTEYYLVLGISNVGTAGGRSLGVGNAPIWASFH